MGKFKSLFGGAIAALGIAWIAAAEAEVVAVPIPGGQGYHSLIGVEAPSPSMAAGVTFAFNDPIPSANRNPNSAAAPDISNVDANRPANMLFGIELPQVSTWMMIALGFVGLGFAAFHSPRKRQADLFS